MLPSFLSVRGCSPPYPWISLHSLGQFETIKGLQRIQIEKKSSRAKLASRVGRERLTHAFLSCSSAAVQFDQKEDHNTLFCFSNRLFISIDPPPGALRFSMSPIFSRGLTGAAIRRELGFAASLEAMSATWGKSLAVRCCWQGVGSAGTPSKADARPTRLRLSAKGRPCRTVWISSQACRARDLASRMALIHIWLASSIRQIPMEQRFTFYQVASVYSKVRPDYPDALVDDVVSYADLKPTIGFSKSAVARVRQQRALPGEAFRSSRLTLDRKCFVARAKA